MTSELRFLCPDWGPALRGITHEELQLYLQGKASPVRPGRIRGDYLEPDYR